MTATPTTTAQQPTEAEYEAYLAEQEAAGEAAYAAYLADYEPPEAAAADDWPEPDDDDLVSTRTWIRWHTVSDRDVANLTRELDDVEDSFLNEDVLIGYALSGDDVADRAKLDRSTAPYLRYLAARAAAVVDRIDGKYVGWVGAERLEPVRERALELAGSIEDEAAFVEGSREFPPLTPPDEPTPDPTSIVASSGFDSREHGVIVRMLDQGFEVNLDDAMRYGTLLCDLAHAEQERESAGYDVMAYEVHHRGCAPESLYAKSRRADAAAKLAEQAVRESGLLEDVLEHIAELDANGAYHLMLALAEAVVH